MIANHMQREIELLEPMPASAVRLARMLDDKSARIDDIIRVVQTDPALAAHVLRLANSAWCAAASPILTIKAAVIRLGLSRIAWFAVSRRVARPMQAPLSSYQLAAGELWGHSVACALAAEQINRQTGNQLPPAAFTASLLHDIGKLIMSRHLPPDALDRVRELVAREHLTATQAERRLLGTDHAEVGGAMALAWKFPPQLVAAIARHHDTGGADNKLRDAIQVSNAVSKLIGMGLGNGGMIVDIDEQSPNRLGLSAVEIESTCATVCDDLGKVITVCGSENHGAECAGSRR